MAIADFFDHQCSIYHVTKSSDSLGYGLTNGDEYDYPASPDISNVRCHFAVGASVAITQGSPQNEYTTEIKLSLPAGTDIRLNDKVTWVNFGRTYEYVAKIPRNIRGHHISVMLQRVGIAGRAL